VQDDTGAYLVRVSDNATLAPLLKNPALRDSRVSVRIPWGNGWLLRLEAPDEGDTTAWRQAVSQLPEIRGMVREGRKYKFSDPELPKQWSHASTTANTTQAWELVTPESQASIVVAVLDTGLDITHPEFAGRVVTPFNAMNGATPTTSVTDNDGHGTHVTGIIAADGQNETGGAGVAWGVRILPIKVLTAAGGTDAEILRGFMHAVNWRPSPDDGSRVRVINMSLGNSSADVSAIYTEAVAIAEAAGIVVVAASGNNSAGFVASPANSPGVLAVGSSFRHAAWEGVSTFSNGGPRLDLVAPGEEIYAPLPGDRYGYFSGTSMASPYVAGVAALLVARYDPLNARTDANFVDLVRQRLTLAVKDLGLPGRDDLAGSGRLDAGRALAPATLEALP
jgi:subtilisin family serine protease